MHTASGCAQYHGNKLICTFAVDGGPRHLTIAIKTRNQTVECTNLTLIFSDAAELVGDCKWSGTLGKDDLLMDFGDGVSVTGPLDTARSSSVPIRGTGTWSTASEIPVNEPVDDSARAIAPEPSAFDTPKDPETLERETRLLLSGAPIITIFGQSGAGKSTFINLITSEQQAVGRGLQSCTSDINIIKAEVGGKSVVIIDTPGIDDTRTGIKEADVLVSIARRLEDMGERKVWVTGVLFLHRISDNKFSQTANRVSNMLKSLCGDAAMCHLMLCTTMWDKVDEDEGYERLNELCEDGVWKEMISKGAKVSRFSSLNFSAKAEAESIITGLIKNARPMELAIQDELINQGKTVLQTGAGQILDEHLREAREEAEREMEKLRKVAEANATKDKEAIRAQELEVERLKERAKEQAREQRAQNERLLQERVEAERRQAELREQLRLENEARATAARELLLARELELVRLRLQAETHNRERQAEAERLRLEREEQERFREQQQTLERLRQAERLRQKWESAKRLQQQAQAQRRLEAQRRQEREDDSCVIQ